MSAGPTMRVVVLLVLLLASACSAPRSVTMEPDRPTPGITPLTVEQDAQIGG